MKNIFARTLKDRKWNGRCHKNYNR